MSKHVLMLLALAGVSLLSACGGGGGGDGASSGTPAVQTGPLTLTGVVATGDPVKPATAANKVSVKCRNASGVSAEESVSLRADGSYAITLQDSSLPCVLQTDTATPLSSLARGTGPGSAVANITPVTTLVVARVAGKDPVTFYTEFSTSGAALITTDGVSTAITAVKNTLSKAGISLVGVVDLITDTVSTDASTSSTGTLDKAVADLVARGVPLAEVSSDVASTTPVTTASTTSATPSPAAEVLLAPRAANCAAFRSGRYVTMDFVPSSGAGSTGVAAPVTTVGEVDLDAVALRVTNLGTTNVDTFTANGTCRYLGSNGLDEFVVSQSGVVIGRSATSTTAPIAYTMFVAFPKQSLTLADVAGTWNMMSWTQSNGTIYTGQTGTADISSTGVISNARCFSDPVLTLSANCTAEPGPLPLLQAGQAGFGFDLVSQDPTNIWQDRWLAFRAGGGELMIVGVAANGEFTFLSRQRSLTAPALNSATAFWNLTLNDTGTFSSIITEGSNIITALDGSGGYTRAQTGGSPINTHSESLQANFPRNGYTHRNGATNVPATLAAGGSTSVTVQEFISLNLRGMGLNALYLPNTAPTPTFSISVNK